jgi:hypothetical protein
MASIPHNSSHNSGSTRRRHTCSTSADRFERLRREYFFINQFPENDARFDVTFDQCWPAGLELRID